MTNSMWVTLDFFFFTMQSHCISSHDQQDVSDTGFVFLYHAVSLYFISWPIGSEWHWICFSLPCSLIAFHPMTNREWVTLDWFFFTMQSHCISSHDQQDVSDTAFVFFTMQSHCISSHDQQDVSDTAFVVLYHAVSLHFIPWPTESEWHCICFSLPCSLIAFHPMTNRMWVTLHLFFLPCSLIAFHPMTNRMWVTLHLLFFTMHFIPWPTVCEWHWICFSLPCSLIAFHPMTNREWVTLPLFFFTMQSHCISSHDQQYVSDSTFVFLYHAVSSHSSHYQQYVSDTAFVFLSCAVSLHFIPWPTGSEWHCICVSLPCSLIAFHPTTNRQWVTLHLCFFTMQSHCISSHDQQTVSDTAFVFLYHAVSLHFIPWPKECEWHCICFSLPCRLIAFHPMTNSQWVTLDLFLFTMQSHCISSHDQQDVSDTAFVFLYHAVWLHFIHDQQLVSDSAVFVSHVVSLHLSYGEQKVSNIILLSTWKSKQA